MVYTAYSLLSPAPAQAQSVSLGVQPPIFEVSALPPATIKSDLHIKNFSDTPTTVSIQLKPFKASNTENGRLTYINDPNTIKTLSQYVHLEKGGQPVTELTIPPDTDIKLTVVMDVPKDQPAKDYYFSIIFIANPDTKDVQINQSASKTTGGIATNVLLSIGPFDQTTGSIEEFSAPVFVDKGPLPFTLRVKNSSHHVIAPQGEILISNMFGQTIGKVDLLPVNILSNSVRAIPDTKSVETNSSASLQSTGYRLQEPKTVWPEKFLIGPYTANLRLLLSDSGPVYRRSIHFFALPLQGFLAIIVAIVIVLFLFQRLKKYR